MNLRFKLRIDSFKRTIDSSLTESLQILFEWQLGFDNDDVDDSGWALFCEDSWDDESDVGIEHLLGVKGLVW